MNLTDLIIKHEGLIDYQTPFRITSPSMGKWTSMFDDTIGLELDPGFDKPDDRQNFLYLKNKDDIDEAVAEQLRRYAEKPARYGLPDNPSVAEAIMVFDQTGSAGKIEYLRGKGVDINKPLANYIGE